MICLMSPLIFSFCHWASASYGLALIISKPYEKTCVVVVEEKEVIMPRFRVPEGQDFCGCGHAEQIIGKYR